MAIALQQIGNQLFAFIFISRPQEFLRFLDRRDPADNIEVGAANECVIINRGSAFLIVLFQAGFDQLVDFLDRGSFVELITRKNRQDIQGNCNSGRGE